MKSSLRRLNVATSQLQWTLLLVALVTVGLLLVLRLTGWAVSSGADPPAAGRPGYTKQRPPKPLPRGVQGEQALDGQRLVLAAVDQLAQGPSVSARLHQRIKLFDGDVLGVGAYRQEASRDGGRFNIQLRTKTGALQVVSDGTYVWQETAVGPTRRISRIDLQYERHASTHDFLDGRSRAPRQLLSRRMSPLAFGGMAKLLTDIGRRYRFETIQIKVLSDVPIYEISGVLRPVDSASARSPAGGGNNTARAAATVPPLPPQVPSHVTVSLGRDDFFPYRIVFDARNADAADQQRGAPRRVEIQFSEVTIGGPVDNRWFEYSPPRDVGWDDITAESVAKLEGSA